MKYLYRYAKSLISLARRIRSRFRGITRETAATQYLRGQGLEIGALHNPLTVPRKAHVRYVDRMSVADLRRQYPELGYDNITEPDILDDGERLTTIPAESQDFLIANHFLEHCENPIDTLRNFLRVLKTGGILYLCVPDKRYTFDRDRPVTPFEHLERDFREGPAWSRLQHFEEWVQLVEKVSAPEQARARVGELLNLKYSIHYHVWTQTELLELVGRLRDDYRMGIELELFTKLGEEVLLVLRRT